MEEDKPHLGRIENWKMAECDARFGLGYFIRGRFVGHPYFAGEYGHTSWVVAHNLETGEIETRNSRYTLV